MMTKSINNRPLSLDDLSQEVQLMLILSRPIPPKDWSFLEQIIVPSFDWKQFLRLGLKSKLASLLYYNEKKWGLDIIPAHVRQQFKTFQLQLLALNTHLYRDFITFQKAANEKGIRCFPIKGIYLAEKIYPENYLRQLSDIDLVVSPEDHNQIMTILHDLKWTVYMTVYKSKFHEKHLTFHTPYNALTTQNIPIDFHYELFDKGKGISMPMSELSSRFQKEEIKELTFNQLDINDTFIYQCLHLYKHVSIMDGIKLSAFAELNWFIENNKDKFNCQSVLSRSKEFEVEDKVKTILTLIKNLWISENHPFFENVSLSFADRKTNRIILRELGLLQFQPFERLKYVLLNRLKEQYHGWHTLPLLWYDLFPGKIYMSQIYQKKTYLANWLKRLH